MKSRLRPSLLAIACVMAMSSGAAIAADPPVDTSKLPRFGGTEIYASALQTIFSVREPVAVTAETASKSLVGQGWQRFEAPFSTANTDPNQIQMSFKKGQQGLSVFITLAPAQGNATTVQYGPLPLETDLPFPTDASNIEFSANRPYLKTSTADSVEKALTFFATEMTAQGWSAWSTKIAAKIPLGEKIGDMTEKGALAYFVRDGKPPVLLVLQRLENGRTLVEIKVVPKEELNPQAAREAALAAKAQEEARMAQAREAAQKEHAQRSAQFDSMAAGLLADVQRSTRDSLAGAMVPPLPQQKPAPGEQQPLRDMTSSPAPIPLPENADAIDYKRDTGRLEYRSTASVAALAAFYQNRMKQLGWREQPSVIKNANMSALVFQKDGKKVSLTIMQMGASARVSGDGNGLVAATTGVGAAAGAIEEPVKALEADERDGYPIPKERSASGTTKTPFRMEINATVTASVNSVVAFYRSELTKRNWTEVTKGADIRPDKAVLNFTSPEGPVVLTVDRDKSKANIVLALRKHDEASKSGLLPKPGQVKLLISSMLDQDSTLTIDKKNVKVGPQVGLKAPDGPTLDLPPGKYKISIKSGNKPAVSDEITVAADTIWGLVVGPGGILPMQVY